MKKIITIFFFFIAIGNIKSQPNCSRGIHSDDVVQLQQLYNATDGSHWLNGINWNSPTELNWYGVKWRTINDFCRVDSITLKNNGLRDSLPLLTFPYLTYLNLNSNKLSGQIPDFNLPSLKYLYLSNNNFAGTLPLFSNLQQLEILNVSYNPKLGGNLPNFNLPNLKELYLQACSFEGKVPNWNLPNLMVLNVNCNKLDSIDTLGIVMPRLEHLDISHNKTWRGKLGQLATFSNLKKMNLDAVGFPINADFNYFPKLEYLSLSQNKYNTVGYEFLPKGLRYLDLSDNVLTGAVDFVHQFPKLSDLRLSNNQFNAIALKAPHLALQRLYLDENIISDGVENLSFLPNIDRIYLERNNIASVKKSITLPSISILNIAQNSLDYYSLDSFTCAKNTKMYYHPQHLNIPITTTYKYDNTIILSVPYGKREEYKFQWIRRQDKMYQEQTKDSFLIPAKSGTYYCEISSSKYPNLKMISADKTVVIDELSKRGDFLVYPNPNNGNFHVHLYYDLPIIANFEVYDVLGRLVYQVEKVHPNTDEVFNLDFLPNGQYTMLYKVNDRTELEILVIDK